MNFEKRSICDYIFFTFSEKLEKQNFKGIFFSIQINFIF